MSETFWQLVTVCVTVWLCTYCITAAWRARGVARWENDEDPAPPEKPRGDDDG